MNIETTNQNSLLLLPIKDLANKKFVIGSYQRGYKWGKKEILELLNDIHSYDKSMGLYCLQPLILKPIDLNTPKVTVNDVEIYKNNEVVDGQQRTTTIYLILKYLAYKKWIPSDLLYEIDFQTRKRSGLFLNDHLHSIYDLTFDNISETEFSIIDYNNLDAVNGLWSSFVADYKQFDNVDIYHFFIVSCYLIRWMEVNLEQPNVRNSFIEKFTESVKVIWYSLEASQNHVDIIKVFLNNNKGKISLTSSELIKALFVLDIKNREVDSIAAVKINQFATEWDWVEKQLQNDRFWYFIQPDETNYKQGTRIDFLFDLELKKPDLSDSFFAYRMIESLFNENKQIFSEKKQIAVYWENILRLHNKFINWFEDKELYHFIGFLTNSRIKSLKQIFEVSKDKSREVFKSNLKHIIKDEFNKTVTRDKIEIKPYSIDNLHYKNFYNETLNVLLLYNVLYYLENMAGYKFPFDLYVKQHWSIEHINPQSPKCFDDKHTYIQWIRDMHDYSNKSSIINLIAELEKTDIDEIKNNKSLTKSIDNFLIEIEEFTHSIENLLLLDRNTNSSLGNNSFKRKRNKILEFDNRGYNDEKESTFIPIETLNAFNKTKSKNLNIESWTREDGDNYCNAISARLIEYLPKKINR